MKLYRCKKCGKIIILLEEGALNTVCCGEDMVELVPRSVDGAIEKHVPVVISDGDKIKVKVGEVDHPMTEEHYIEFIIIETSKGYTVRNLKPGDSPSVDYILSEDEEYVNAYAYCNLHGLWNNK